MKRSIFAAPPAPFAALAVLLAAPALAAAQAPAAPPAAAAPESLKAIDEDYNRQLLQLERQRLQRLGRLAAGQPPAEAAATLEQLFRLAIARNLFTDAEEVAARVVRAGTPAPTTAALARLVKIVAEADRGAYEQSVKSLTEALAAAGSQEKGASVRAALSSDEIIGICDAYYQRLVHSDQIATARKAMRLALEHARNPTVREYLAGRLKRLEMVGKPAPPISGTDLDGKPFDLADSRGKVVLVVFWASWCLANSAEVDSLRDALQEYRSRGLQIVGIDLDPLDEVNQKVESVLPHIRHFLLEHNIRWPNLLNGTGEKDYAAAYGITHIPSSVLIGRDGTIVQLDLVRKNLSAAISRALAP